MQQQTIFIINIGLASKNASIEIVNNILGDVVTGVERLVEIYPSEYEKCKTLFGKDKDEDTTIIGAAIKKMVKAGDLTSEHYATAENVAKYLLDIPKPRNIVKKLYLNQKQQHHTQQVVLLT